MASNANRRAGDAAARNGVRSAKGEHTEITKTRFSAQWLSVYDGTKCLGHVLSRGPKGVEAFDREDNSLGNFPNHESGSGCAGQGAGMSEHECMPIDPYMVFLDRAHARLILVNAGQMTPKDAIAGLIEPFREVAHGAFCHCECEMMARMFRDQPKVQKFCTPKRRAAA